MTEAQLVAFENPCVRAQGTTEPRFARMGMEYGEFVSVILTVNK